MQDSVPLKRAALWVGLTVGIGLWLTPAVASAPSGIPLAQALEFRDPNFFLADPRPTPAEAPTPEGSPAPAPSPIGIPLTGQEGTEVLVGNIPVFRLQTADYPSDVRADNVRAIIERFLEEGQLPEPEVRVAQDANGQYILRLGERGRFERTQRYLFTVTYADAAAERRVAPGQVNLNDVRLVANSWARRLEQAIADYREDLLALQRAQDPRVLVLTLLAGIATLVVGFFLWRLFDRSLTRLQRWLELKAGETWGTWIDVGGMLLRGVGAILIAGISLDRGISFIPALRPFQRSFYLGLGRVVATALGVLTQPLPNSSVSIASLLVFLVLSILVFTGAHYVSVGFKQRFLARLGLDLGTQESSAAIFKYILTLFGILLVLPFSGLNLGSLAVIAGAVGLGIGFGLQNLSNNYISYIAILLERPIQIGDLVEVDNLLGTVERIGPRATVLRTLDRIFVIVPNSRFTESKVVNWSYRDPRCRIHIPVGVAYGSDTALVTEALLSAARENARVLSSPAPQVWLKSFGPSALNFELLVWINRPQDQFVLISELNFLIEAEFRRRGIRIPFPQQDIHIRSLEGFAPLSQNGGSPSLPDTDSIHSALKEAAQSPEDQNGVS
ncbi:mechanosensitive ion channel [Synechococcus sp. R55.6]|uniref:mechanosensitive ion channel domain-containing protein n=1 Tax=unclassified Synechococcus TaxID=2626047 RepID=UPI0039C4D26C